MAKDIIDERIAKKQAIKDEIVNKQLKELKKVLKSEKYDMDTLIQDSKLGGVYHDLVDSEDLMNSNIQKNYNKTYHALDVESYKLNEKIDGKIRNMDSKVDDKIKKMEFKIKKMY